MATVASTMPTLLAILIVSAFYPWMGPGCPSKTFSLSHRIHWRQRNHAS